MTEFPEMLQVALIYFSAVSLAQLEFFKNAFPRRDIVLPDKEGVIWAIFFAMVAPTVVLLAIDRGLAARWPGGRWNRWFRGAVFAICLLMILRQIEVYSGSGQDLADSIREASRLLMVASTMIAAAGVLALCLFAQRGVTTFFYYMSPIAVAVVAIIPFQLYTSGGLPEGYRNEVENTREGEPRDPVFVLLFDEMSYSLLADDSGKVDAEMFPNIAALAGQSAWFTNATANYFWSFQSVPMVSRPITDLRESYDVRLYSQYPSVEATYKKGCGVDYTCRGIEYVTSQKKSFFSATVAMRMAYNATPPSIYNRTGFIWGLAANSLGVAYPSTDESGFHTFTKAIWSEFMGDISQEASPGRAHFVHVFLPHFPEVFTPTGKALASPLSTDRMRASQEQTRYVDTLIGDFVEKLQAEELYDRSTIIVTSDHGFRGPPPVPPAYDLQDHTTRIPLIIHSPNVAAVVSDVDYQHFDFEETLHDVLDLPPPTNLDGVSAFATTRSQRDKTFRVQDPVAPPRWTMDFRYDPPTGQWILVPATLAD